MDKKLLGLITIFFLSFLLFISVVVFNKPLTQFTRAKEDLAPSGANSLIFAWPLTARADGSEEVTVNVFVRSENNKLVTDRTVTVTSTLGTVKVVTDKADNTGKTTFKVTAASPGTAEISATIDNSIPVAQKISVRFE